MWSARYEECQSSFHRKYLIAANAAMLSTQVGDEILQHPSLTSRLLVHSHTSFNKSLFEWTRPESLFFVFLTSRLHVIQRIHIYITKAYNLSDAWEALNVHFTLVSFRLKYMNTDEITRFKILWQRYGRNGLLIWFPQRKNVIHFYMLLL